MAHRPYAKRMIDRKNKMVSFRLSQEEYQTLRTACSAHGIGSISELARVAMERMLDTENVPGSVQEQVRELRSRVAQLAEEVESLSKRLDPQFSVHLVAGEPIWSGEGQS